MDLIASVGLLYFGNCKSATDKRGELIAVVQALVLLCVGVIHCTIFLKCWQPGTDERVLLGSQ